MNIKKIIISIVAAMLAICLGIFTYITYNEDKNVYEENINIDLVTLDNTFSKLDAFSNIKMKNIDKDTLFNIFNIDKNLVVEVIGKMPIIDVKSSMYIVIKTNSQALVKTKLEEFAKQLESQWSTYLESEFNLVKNRIISTKGDYVYLIIADNAKEIEQKIK
ncbi:MAG: DUF4358 domain-containing protein [Clostridia bacterium]